MASRADRLRDGVARLAARIAERREQQLAKEAAITRPGRVPGEDPLGEGDGPGSGTGTGPSAGSGAGVGATEPGQGVPSGAQPPGSLPGTGLGAGDQGRPAPATAVPWGVRVAAEAGWRLLVLAGLVWVLIQVISSISLLVLSFSAGLLVTALLQPTVARLKRHGVGRGLATTITFVTGFVVMGLVGWFVVWQVTENLPTLTERVQQAIEEGKRWAIQGPFHVSENQVNDIAKNLSQWLGDNSQEVTSAGLEGVTVLLEFLSGAVLTMFITLFLLYDGRGIWGWFLKLVPSGAREGVAGAGPRAWVTLTGYVRGTVIVAMIDAIFIGVGIYFLDVPLAVPLAVLIFIFAFVPIVGAVVSGALAVLVAFVTNGPLTGLLVLGVVLLVQQIESHVLQPFILGRLVRVHPLAVVLAVTGGSLIAGIPGAVVAVPLVAVINTATGYLRAYSEEQRGGAVPCGAPGTGTGAALGPASGAGSGAGAAGAGAGAGGGAAGAGSAPGSPGASAAPTEPAASPTESADGPPPAGPKGSDGEK